MWQPHQCANGGVGISSVDCRDEKPSMGNDGLALDALSASDSAVDYDDDGEPTTPCDAQMMRQNFLNPFGAYGLTPAQQHLMQQHHLLQQHQQQQQQQALHNLPHHASSGSPPQQHQQTIGRHQQSEYGQSTGGSGSPTAITGYANVGNSTGFGGNSSATTMSAPPSSVSGSATTAGGNQRSTSSASDDQVS
jgi:hypothetical protein